MAKRYKLGSSFIGYNKGQVDMYIDSLMESNAIKLDEIRRRVNDCRSEMDKLNRNLSDKQKEMDEHKKSRKYMEFALKRVESTAELISAYAQNERRELDDGGRAKLDEYDREIEKLSKEIKNKEEHLNFLVRRASKPKQVKNTNNDEAEKIPVGREEVRIDSSRKVRGFSFWDESSYEEHNAAIEIPPEKKELKAVTGTPEELQDRDNARMLPREYPSSPALSADISQVRNKYLVGKIAGDNLIARDGGLIISKNSVISAETVKRAEEEGKLAELIINMVLPGMEN